MAKWKQHGPRWNLIAKHLPNRTQKNVRDRFKRLRVHFKQDIDNWEKQCGTCGSAAHAITGMLQSPSQPQQEPQHSPQKGEQTTFIPPPEFIPPPPILSIEAMQKQLPPAAVRREQTNPTNPTNPTKRLKREPNHQQQQNIQTMQVPTIDQTSSEVFTGHSSDPLLDAFFRRFGTATFYPRAAKKKVKDKVMKTDDRECPSPISTIYCSDQHFEDAVSYISGT